MLAAVAHVFDLLMGHWTALAITGYLVVVLTSEDPQGRALRLAISLDILLFALFTFGHSKRNETASAACWELYRDGKWQGKLFKPLIDWLFIPLEKDHCLQAWRVEQPK